MSTVAIIGAGPIGGALAQAVARRGRVGEVRLIDPEGRIAEGKALDILQSSPVEPFTTQTSQDGKVLVLSVPIVGDGQNDESQSAVKKLRSDVIPGTIGAVSGVSVLVDGAAAQTVDGNDNLASHAPLVFGFVLTMAVLYVALNLIIDMLYGVIDPRVRVDA